MSNRLRPRRPTIHDVAREAGVSVATISRVLNRRPGVAPETRKRVLRVIRDQGFSSSRTARALSGGRTGLVGVTLPKIESSYFGILADGVADALYDHDMRAVLCPTRHERDREVGLLERLMHGLTDGAVLILPSESSDELLALQEGGYPFVVLDPKTPVAPGIACVSAANAPGAAAATKHLLELGHRRIGALTGPAGWCATEERLAGYRGALAGAGLLADPALEAEADFEVAGGRAAAERLLALPDPPTAVLAFNDNMAVGAFEAARARGLRLPGDLSVVGFDDAEHAALVTPALTTVRQPLREMARMSVDLLDRLLAGAPLEALRVELATRLVLRESTAPPSAGSYAAKAQAGSAASGSPLAA
jgi:LacI family transcriptional regulator